MKKNLPSYSLPLSQADRWCSPSNVKLKPYNLSPIGAASVHEKKKKNLCSAAKPSGCILSLGCASQLEAAREPTSITYVLDDKQLHIRKRIDL